MTTSHYIILAIWITGIPLGFLAWKNLISWKETLDLGDLLLLVVPLIPIINILVYLEQVKLGIKNPFYKK